MMRKRTLHYYTLSLLLVAAAFYNVICNYATIKQLNGPGFKPIAVAHKNLKHAHTQLKYFHYSHFNTTQLELTTEMKKWQVMHEEQFKQTLRVESIADNISILIHDPSEDIFVSTAFSNGVYWDETGMAAIVNHIELILNRYKIKPHSLRYNLQHRLGILDVGANIGSFSLGFAKYFQYRYPFIDVFSFEPLWLNYVLLTRSIQLNELDNIYLFPYGLSASSAGNKSFIIDNENKGHSHVEGDHSWSESDGLKVQIETVSLDSILGSKLIPATAMSSFGNTIWMKIDTEGYEKFVFYGGAHFFADPKHAPCFIKTEFRKNKEDIFNALTSYGYSIVPGFNWNTIQQQTVSAKSNRWQGFGFLSGITKAISEAISGRPYDQTGEIDEAFFVRNDLMHCVAHKIENIRSRNPRQSV